MYKSTSHSGKKSFKNNSKDKHQGSWRRKAEIENKETTVCSKEVVENKEATAYYNKGMAAFNLKRYEKAVGYYDQALSIDPEYFDAHYRKGMALYKSGNLREAISCYDKALRNSRGVIIIEEYETVMKSDCADVYYNKGKAHEDMGKIFEAMECYQNAVTIRPNHIEVNLHMGLASFKLGNSKTALKYYNNILSVNPKHTKALYNKGNALFSLEKFNLALKCYEDASLIESKTDLSIQGSAFEMIKMMMSYSKARNLVRLEDLNGAIAWYETALKQCDANIKNPYNAGLKKHFDAFYAMVYCDMGNAFLDLGDEEEAFEYYDDAILFKTDYADAYYYKGVALCRMGKWVEAIENYDEAILFKADHADAYYHKGMALYAMGRWEEAIECYGEAVSHVPDYVDAYISKGNIFRDLKRNAEAVDCYNEAIRLKPKNDYLHNNKGRVLFKAGDNLGALQSYDEALRLNPKNAFSHCNKARVLAKLGETEEALEYYDKALSLNPKNAYAYYGKGRVLDGLGRQHEAIQCYNEAIKFKSDHTMAYYSKARTLLELATKDLNEGNRNLVESKLTEAADCFNEATLHEHPDPKISKRFLELKSKINIGLFINFLSQKPQVSYKDAGKFREYEIKTKEWLEFYLEFIKENTSERSEWLVRFAECFDVTKSIKAADIQKNKHFFELTGVCKNIEEQYPVLADSIVNIGSFLNLSDINLLGDRDNAE